MRMWPGVKVFWGYTQESAAGKDVETQTGNREGMTAQCEIGHSLTDIEEPRRQRRSVRAQMWMSFVGEEGLQSRTAFTFEPVL